MLIVNRMVNSFCSWVYPKQVFRQVWLIILFYCFTIILTLLYLYWIKQQLCLKIPENYMKIVTVWFYCELSVRGQGICLEIQFDHLSALNWFAIITYITEIIWCQNISWYRWVISFANRTSIFQSHQYIFITHDKACAAHVLLTLADYTKNLLAQDHRRF